MRERQRIHSWLVTGSSQNGIRFEQVMQTLRDSVDPDLRILQFCECSSTPTFLHRFLARALQSGPVITTNFDSLIELAWLEQNPEKPTVAFVEARKSQCWKDDPTAFAGLRSPQLRRRALLKVHGSLRHPTSVLRHGSLKLAAKTEGSVAATLDRIGSSQRLWGLEPFKERAVTSAIRGRLLVVIGYSGTDDFDVVPTLARVGHHAAGVVWISHDPGPSKCRLLRSSRLPTEFPEALTALTTRIPVWFVRGQTAVVLSALFPGFAPPAGGSTVVVSTSWRGVGSLPRYERLSRSHKVLVRARLAELAGRTTQAQNWFKLAIKLASSVRREHVLVRAYAYVRLGWIAYVTGRPYIAVRYSQVAARLYRRARDWRQASRAIGNIGNGYLLSGRLDDAIRWYQRARRLHRRLGMPSREAIVIGNIGVALRKQGKHDDALKYFRTALTINESVHNFEGVANDLGNIGNIYLARRRYAEASGCYERVIAICEKLRKASCVAIQFGNIGIARRHQRQYRAARAALKTALQINRRLGRQEGIAENLSNLGRVFEDRGEYHAALRLFRSAIRIELRVRDLEGQAVVYEDIGRTLAKLRRPGAARVALDRSRNGYQRLNNTAAVMRIEKMQQRLSQ